MTAAAESDERFACTAAAGCDFDGDWPSFLAHAAAHPLPAPSDRAAWLVARRTFVGASEVAAICGVNPYSNALDVWATKVRGLERGEDSRATRRLGLLMEPVLLADYAARHQVEVRPGCTTRHPVVPWAAATPDGLAEGIPIQVKLVGANMLHHWKEGPPRYVTLQVQWELFVTGAPRGVILAGLGGTDLEEHDVERDDELIDFARTLCEAFWTDSVVPRSLPVDFDGPTSRETLQALFPRAALAMAPAPEEVVHLAELYAAARAEESEAADRKEAIGEKIKLAIADREGLDWRGGKVTWKAAKGSTRWQELALWLGARAGITPPEWIQRVNDFTPPDGSRRLVVAVKKK